MDARRRHAAGRYGLLVVVIKTRIGAAAPMPNASVDTVPESRK
jgi:hypothetical protein